MFEKLAFKNIWRRKTRTVIIIVLISFSLTGLFFLQGLYDGMIENMIENAIKNDAGEIVVYEKDFRKTDNLKNSINDYKSKANDIRGIKHVEHVSSRITIAGVAATGRKNMGVKIIGISADNKGNVLFLDQEVVDKFLKNKRNIIIGAGLAEKLKVKSGNKVVLSAQSRKGKLVSGAFRVSDIVKTGDPLVDKQAVFADFSFINSLFEMDNTVTSIHVKVKSNTDLFLVTSEIEARFKGVFEVLPWQKRYPRIQLSKDSLIYYNAISYGVVFFVVALGVLDVILISVMERLKEFGILISIGTPYRKIASVIFLESLFTGVLGMIFGGSLGYLILIYFNKSGLDLGYFAEGMEKFGFNSVLYTDVRPEYLLYAFTAVISASLIAAVVPVIYIIRKKPLEMTRG